MSLTKLLDKGDPLEIVSEFLLFFLKNTLKRGGGKESRGHSL